MEQPHARSRSPRQGIGGRSYFRNDSVPRQLYWLVALSIANQSNTINIPPLTATHIALGIPSWPGRLRPDRRLQPRDKAAMRILVNRRSGRGRQSGRTGSAGVGGNPGNSHLQNHDYEISRAEFCRLLSRVRTTWCLCMLRAYQLGASQALRFAASV
jgi:hypothetical protein